MRVLHVLWNGEIGGAQRAVFQLVANQFKQPDMQISVAFGRATGPYVQQIIETGAKVIDINMRSGHDIKGFTRAYRAFGGFDLHHFHVAEPIMMSASLFRPGTRRIYTYRTAFNDRKGKRALRYMIVGTLLKRGFHALSSNTAHGAEAAEALFSLRKGSVYVTYNGIAFELLTPNRTRQEARSAMKVPENEFLIGTVANLKPVKRIDWLIKAVAKLPQRAWRLIVVGDGPERASLEQLAQNLGIRERLTFVGWQSHAPDWLVGFDAFCLPSSPAESFGNAVVEAMALGVPSIICTDSGGMVEHIVDQETGLLADGIPGLTNSLLNLIDDPHRARLVGAAGRQAVRHKYSVASMLATYDQLYSSTLTTSRVL